MAETVIEDDLLESDREINKLKAKILALEAKVQVPLDMSQKQSFSTVDFNEMAVPSSALVSVGGTTTEAPGVASIRDDQDKVIGMCFRTMFNGESVLVTASHVWMGIIRSGDSTFYVEHKGTKLPIDLKTWKLVASAPAHQLDVVMVQPSLEKSLNALGMKSLRCKACPAHINVTVYGFQDGKFMFSRGSANHMKAQPFMLTHYASTARGYSGTPLLNVEGHVIGVHTGVAKSVVKDGVAANAATSCFWLLLELSKESDIPFDLRGFKLVTDFDDYDNGDDSRFDKYEEYHSAFNVYGLYDADFVTRGKQVKLVRGTARPGVGGVYTMEDALEFYFDQYEEDNYEADFQGGLDAPQVQAKIESLHVKWEDETKASALPEMPTEFLVGSGKKVLPSPTDFSVIAKASPCGSPTASPLHSPGSLSSVDTVTQELEKLKSEALAFKKSVDAKLRALAKSPAQSRIASPKPSFKSLRSENGPCPPVAQKLKEDPCSSKQEDSSKQKQPSKTSRRLEKLCNQIFHTREYLKASKESILKESVLQQKVLEYVSSLKVGDSQGNLVQGFLSSL
jgi:hypothetical protein